MLKVLIADDEKNICLMIQKLVNWESYGMEVIALVHNGLDAMRVIEQQRPQLVISDIRMPGYDGLEIVKRTRQLELDTDFVIISGYKQFEYAHTALNLGVEHYLLKPIDKQELEETLEKLCQKHAINRKKEAEQERLMEQVRDSKRTVRQHFLTDIIKKNGTINTVLQVQKEETDCYGFEQDRFWAFMVKLDTEDRAQKLDGVLQMAEHMIEYVFQQGKCEYINSRMNSGIITILNYKQEEKSEIRSLIEKCFHKLFQELEKFGGFHVTLGVGGDRQAISETADSIQEAINAVKCRARVGMNKVIYYDQLHYREASVKEILEETRREMRNMVTVFDYEALRGLATKDLKNIQAIPMCSPVAIYEYIENVTQLVAETLRKNGMDEEVVSQMEENVRHEMDYYVDMDEIVYRSFEVIRLCLEKLFAQRKNRSQRPIRMAREYIQQHYAQQVTLEEVAEAIGLSPAYLSTMFKKEMGISFSDCLISCRIDVARLLLKESDLSIREVAEQVGYMDARYFSKVFNKIVGLKPSVYRKMYR